MRKVLFVCSANVDRSKTAEVFFAEQFGTIQFKSAGTDAAACAKEGTTHLTSALIDWANEIYVMEQEHADWIQTNLPSTAPITILGISDDYRYYSIKLIQLLQEKATRLLEK